MQKNILIAFDFDGVVANTIPMLSKVFSLFLNRYGIPSDAEDFESYNGKVLFDIITHLRGKYNIRETAEQLVSAYRTELLEQIQHIAPMPHLTSALNSLKHSGCSIIISTSANVDYVRKFLKIHALDKYFSEVVSSELYKESKPDPGFYASIQKHFPHHNICAIDDSANGVLSAFNAGVKVIFFNPSKKALPSCFHGEISDFLELPSKIAELFTHGYYVACKNIELKITDKQLHFAENELAEIEYIWSKRPKNVYNGHIVAIDSYQYINGNLILNCLITEYKYIYTVRSKITPLAVSGICFDNANNTLLSVRNQVTDYSGSYELIPSGGIEATTIKENPLGYKQQLVKEFVEELGNTVSIQHIKNIENLGICYDAISKTMDICMRINYDGDFRKETINTNKEYKNHSMLIDNISSVKQSLHGKNVVYTTQEILNHVK